MARRLDRAFKLAELEWMAAAANKDAPGRETRGRLTVPQAPDMVDRREQVALGIRLRWCHLLLPAVRGEAGRCG